MPVFPASDPMRQISDFDCPATIDDLTIPLCARCKMRLPELARSLNGTPDRSRAALNVPLSGFGEAAYALRVSVQRDAHPRSGAKSLSISRIENLAISGV